MVTNQSVNIKQDLIVRPRPVMGRHWFLARLEDLVGFLVFTAAAALVLGPIGYLVYGSLRTGSPRSPSAVFTLSNWEGVYLSDAFLTPFVNTISLSATVAILSVLIGVILAWIVARTDVAGRSHLPILLVIPQMISSLVTTLAWIALAAPNAGFINAGARALFGIQSVFNIYSFWGIALVLILHYVSYAFLLTFAALRSIDSSLEEASHLLGASPIRTAVSMTIPLVWPTLASALLVIFVFVAENFAVPTVLGTPVRFQTLPSRIYQLMNFEPANPPLAATVGTMLMWIALIGTIWQRRLIRRRGRYVTIGTKGSRDTVIHLGRWKYVATGFCFLYFGLAVVLPYLALLLGSLLKFVTPNVNLNVLTLSNYIVLFDARNLLPSRNTILLSVVGGLVATFFYMFLSHLIRRTRGRLAEAIDYLTILPTAIPALVLGVGILWEFVSLPLPIYGTMMILVIGYITRYLGYGVRQSGAALVQVADDLVEAARVTGASPLRSFVDITLPLLKNAIFSIWTMLFIFFFMEVSVTILLYNPQTMTLPMLLWMNMDQGFATRAFAVAVVQASIVLLFLYLANRMSGALRQLVGP